MFCLSWLKNYNTRKKAIEENEPPVEASIHATAYFGWQQHFTPLVEIWSSMAWGHHAIILLFHLPGHRSRCVCWKLQEMGTVLGWTCTAKYSAILSLTSATPHSAGANCQRSTSKARRLHKDELAGRNRMGHGTPLKITSVLDDRAGAVYKLGDTALEG